MSGAAALAALLTAGALLAATIRRLAPTRVARTRAFRCALFFAWILLASGCLRRMHAGAATLPPLDAVVTPALLAASLLLLLERAAARPVLRAAISALAVALLATAAGLLDERASFAGCAISAVAFVLAAALHHAARTGRRAGLRALAHAALAGSSVACFFPAAVLLAAGHPEALATPPPARLAAAFVVAAAALALGGAAGRALVRTGGTPDPWDPPRALATGGIYARLRHPLQLAEVVLAFAAALAFWNRWVTLYALVLAATLLGPLRIYEEIVLRERFGAQAAHYQATVPAYFLLVLPRFPRAPSHRNEPAPP